MAEQKQETPRPWEVEVHTFQGNRKRIVLVSRDDESRFETGYYVVAAEEMEMRQVQAAMDFHLIKHAVNAHDELVAAAKAALGLLADFDSEFDLPKVRQVGVQLESAIARAEQPDTKEQQ